MKTPQPALNVWKQTKLKNWSTNRNESNVFINNNENNIKAMDNFTRVHSLENHKHIWHNRSCINDEPTQDADEENWRLECVSVCEGTHTRLRHTTSVYRKPKKMKEKYKRAAATKQCNKF